MNFNKDELCEKDKMCISDYLSSLTIDESIQNFYGKCYGIVCSLGDTYEYTDIYVYGNDKSVITSLYIVTPNPEHIDKIELTLDDHIFEYSNKYCIHQYSEFEHDLSENFIKRSENRNLNLLSDPIILSFLSNPNACIRLYSQNEFDK